MILFRLMLHPGGAKLVKNVTLKSEPHSKIGAPIDRHLVLRLSPKAQTNIQTNDTQAQPKHKFARNQFASVRCEWIRYRDSSVICIAWVNNWTDNIIDWSVSTWFTCRHRKMCCRFEFDEIVCILCQPISVFRALWPIENSHNRCD